MNKIAGSVGATFLTALMSASVALAQAGASSGAADAQTQAQAQAELDSAVQEARGDVSSASAEFSSDAPTTLGATASEFGSDASAVSDGLSAVLTYTESVALPPAALVKMALDLKAAHALKQHADAIAATSANADSCEQKARLYDKLGTLLDAGAAANASQDELLETIKGAYRQQGSDAAGASLVSSDLLQKLAQSNKAAADINGFLIQQAQNDAENLYYRSCASFAGHFAASMTAHFTTKQGQEWWTYETEINGVARLHYSLQDVRAAQSGASVPLTGEFYGYAWHFAYSTDPYNTAFVKLVAGGRVTKTDTPPIPESRDAHPSYALAQTSPVGFITNVTGSMSVRDMTLQFTDSPKDFDPDYAQGSTTAIVFSPLTNLMPVRNSYKLPYKNARWILDQFFSHGRTIPISLVPDPDGNHELAAFSDTRNRPANQNSADYSIDLNVCDPSCL